MNKQEIVKVLQSALFFADGASEQKVSELIERPYMKRGQKIAWTLQGENLDTREFQNKFRVF